MISHLGEACCTSFCQRRLDSADQLFGKYCGIQEFQNVSLEKQSQEIIHPFTTWQKARSTLSRTMNALFKFDDNNHTVYFPNSWSALSNRRWQNEAQQASPRCEIISRHQPYSKSMLIHWILKVMTSRNVNVWRSSIGFRITYLNRLTSCLSCIRQKRMTVS